MGVASVPDTLKPFGFHKLELDYGKNDKEATGECPFCGRENKFSVNIERSTWRCLVCNEKGNQYTFLEKLWEASDAAYGWDRYETLGKERGLHPETLKEWGVVKSLISGEWLVPGFNKKGELRQLYRYVRMKGGKMRLMATPTMPHQMHGLNLFDIDKKVVYICEGPWDAMKLWEVLSRTKEKDGKFVRTKTARGTLIKGANVVAVPGCSTFHEGWSELFEGRHVYIVYDNDHPRNHPKTGNPIEPASYAGVQRVSHTLGKSTGSTSYLRWGPKGYDPKLPHGTDVSDFLNGAGNLAKLLGKLTPVPVEWTANAKEKTFKDKEIFPVPCDNFKTVSMAWRKALKWGFGLDCSLSVMLASVISTDIVGDQLWIKIIGPASCGKSTLCEALSVSREFVLAKSTIRGFHSGFKSDGAGAEDNSLIARVAGKTLITKDGDTLLQSPNLGQILSEARDIYDKVSRTHYRNKMSKEYTGVNMTWILCGTSSLRSIDNSELGERFLDCVIMEGIDDEWEDDVLMRVVRRENKNISSGEKSNEAPEMVRAKQLTGGYVEYLRENDERLLSGIEIDEEYLKLLARIGKFVACMRARPSTHQQETSEREFAARLVSQHLRLSKCLAVVLNRDSVDEVVMKRVVKVALDTSRGVTYDIARLLWETGKEGSDLKVIGMKCNRNELEIKKLLRFLGDIEVVETFATKEHGIRNRGKYRLTNKVSRLFGDVLQWHDLEVEV